MKRVFITGGSGFIGNAVANAFKREGAHVTCLCHSEQSKKMLEGQGYTAVKGDMESPEHWLNHARASEIIVHAAHLRPGRRLSKKWLKKSMELRDVTLEALIEAGKSNGGCKALIYTSGMVAHGDHGDELIDEEAKPNESALGEYHLTGEALIKESAKEGVPSLCLRPGMVYGSTGTFGKYFLSPAEKGNYQYPGTGDNYLPFVHVNDLAEAYVMAAEDPPVGQVINIVDDEPIQVKMMAERLLDAFGGGKASSVPSWVVGLFAGDALAEMLTGSYRVQNGRAKDVLKWQPKYKSFVEGLPDVVVEYRNLQTN
jgi:nucleoside-diphosphate-sugar epimerase